MKADALTELTCSRSQRRLLLHHVTPYDVDNNEEEEEEEDYDDDYCPYSCAYFSCFSTELGVPLIWPTNSFIQLRSIPRYANELRGSVGVDQNWNVQRFRTFQFWSTWKLARRWRRGSLHDRSTYNENRGRASNVWPYRSGSPTEDPEKTILAACLTLLRNQSLWS